MKENWQYKKLGEACDVINGLWTGKKQPLINVAVIRNTNFSKDCKLKLDDVAYIDVEEKQFISRRLKFGDIIIEKSGGSDKQPVGRAVLFNLKSNNFSFSNFTATLRVKDLKILNPFFLHKSLYFYYKNGETFKMQSKTTGLHNLNMKDYLNLSIPLPDLKEQEKIVAELDLLSGIIDKQKQQLKELDTLAQSIFYSMFGDPILNEKGWGKEKLGKNNEISSAKRVLVQDVVDTGVPFIRGTELAVLSKQNIFDLNIFSMFITKEHYEKVKAITGVPQINDLLIPSINPDGLIWEVSTPSPFYFKDGRVIWVHVNHDILSSKWLRFALSKIISEKYNNLSRGAVFTELTLVFIRNIEIPIPPLSLQNEFAEKIEKIEKQKEAINKSIEETQKLFDYTMDKYFG